MANLPLPPMSSDDSDLPEYFRRWRDHGDLEARDALMARLTPSIRHAVRTALGTSLRYYRETDDFIQDTLIRLLKLLPKLPELDPARLPGLIRTTVSRVVCDYYRHLHCDGRDVDREERHDNLEKLLPRPGNGIHGPATFAEFAEFYTAYLLALDSLTAEERQLLDWIDQGLTVKAIADRLGIGVDAAQKRIDRARQELLSRIHRLLGRDQ